MNPICFVIMGFGEKPDLTTGRKLDLNKTYRNIIEPAITAAGYDCVRADEVLHSGEIDVPMYDMLYAAGSRGPIDIEFERHFRTRRAIWPKAAVNDYHR